jgi:hypothetical protein
MRNYCGTLMGVGYPTSFPFISCEPQMLNILSYAQFYTPTGGYLGTFTNIMNNNYDKTVANAAYDSIWWAPTDVNCNCWTTTFLPLGAVATANQLWTATYANCYEETIRIMCAAPTSATIAPTTKTPSKSPTNRPSQSPTKSPVTRSPTIFYAPTQSPTTTQSKFQFMLTTGTYIGGSGIAAMRSGCAAVTGLAYPTSFPYITCETQISQLTSNAYIYSPEGYLGTYQQLTSGTYDMTTANLAFGGRIWWGPADASCGCWTSSSSVALGSFATPNNFGVANFAACNDNGVYVMCAYRSSTFRPTQSPTTPQPTSSPSIAPTTSFPSRAPTQAGTFAPFPYPPQLTVYLYPLYTTTPSDALCTRALPVLPDTVQGIQTYLFRAGRPELEGAVYRTFTNSTPVSLFELQYRDFRPVLGDGCFYFGDECNSCENWTIQNISASAPAGCIRLNQYNIRCNLAYYYVCAAVLDYDPLTPSPTYRP